MSRYRGGCGRVSSHYCRHCRRRKQRHRDRRRRRHHDHHHHLGIAVMLLLFKSDSGKVLEYSTLEALAEAENEVREVARYGNFDCNPALTSLSPSPC